MKIPFCCQKIKAESEYVTCYIFCSEQRYAVLWPSGSGEGTSNCTCKRWHNATEHKSGGVNPLAQVVTFGLLCILEFCTIDV